MQVVDTFQAIISTDGQRSFSALVYSNPLLIFSSVDTVIGFDSGMEPHADVSKTLLLNNRTLEASNIYRIDGMAQATYLLCPVDIFSHNKSFL